MTPRDMYAHQGFCVINRIKPSVAKSILLNTEPKSGSADLAGAVVRQTLARGGRADRPRVAEPNLAAAFIEPALKALAGQSVRLNRRLRGLVFEGGRVAGLQFTDEVIPVELPLTISVA